MADEIRIGGAGSIPDHGLPPESDQNEALEESGSEQPASPEELNSQEANASGQSSGTKPSDEPAEEKPAASSASSAPVRGQQPRDDRRRLGPTTTPRKPTAGTASKKDEKRLDDGLDHRDELPGEVESSRFQEPEDADSRESNSGQEGDSRLAAATDRSASSAGKNSSSASTTKDLGSGTAAPSGSPGGLARTPGPGQGAVRESVKATPPATGQTPGPAGSSSSPAISRPQAPVRPAPDSLKRTPDSAESLRNRSRLNATISGNPRASYGPTVKLASPAAGNVSLRQLKNGEFVAWGQNRAASPAATGSPAPPKLSAESAAGQVIRERLKSDGNRRASVGSAVSSTQITGNKLSSDQQKLQQIQLERRRRASTSF